MPQNPLDSKISWLGTRLLFLVHNMLIILLLLQMQSSSLIKVDGFKGQMVPGHKFRGIFIHNPIRPFRVRQKPCEFYITNIILLFRVLIKVVAFHFRQSIYFGQALYFLLYVFLRSALSTFSEINYLVPDKTNLHFWYLHFFETELQEN